MFVRVAAEANDEYEFKGKIFLEKIAAEKVLQWTTYRNNFHHDLYINNALKSGEWYRLYPGDPTLLTSDFFRLIVDVYYISKEMKEQLCLRYDSFVNGTKRINTFGNNDEILHNKNITEEKGTVRPLTINDLQLYQWLQAGSTVN